MSETKSEDEIDDSASISISEFFESTPPGVAVYVNDVAQSTSTTASYHLRLPILQLHCGKESCGGLRFFACKNETIYLQEKQWVNRFLTFRCRNCSGSGKIFAIGVCLQEDTTDGIMFKFGESPQFGPPTPARVITLIGPDRELFLMGRRSENQGMGIGAFSYYRRVVEDQKNRMLDEIIRVAEKIGASTDLLKELAIAKEEQQFTKAIDSIKQAIPQALLINGHNPLMLLHSALSKGLHAQTDEECLDLAHTIRMVLTEFAERLSQAMKDEVELNAAINRLLQVKSKSTKNGS